MVIAMVKTNIIGTPNIERIENVIKQIAFEIYVSQNDQEMKGEMRDASVSINRQSAWVTNEVGKRFRR